MKKTFGLVVSLVFLALTVPAQVTAPAMDSTTEQAINHLREGLTDSFNHDDLERLISFLDPNVVVTWQNGEVCDGTNAVKAYYTRMMKGDHPVVAKVTSDPKILGRHFQGDWAVSWGALNDRFTLTDGRELPLDSHFTATIVRRGDKWMVAAFHVSVNAFDNPVMTLAVKRTALAIGAAGALVGLLLGLAGYCLFRRSKSRATA